MGLTALPFWHPFFPWRRNYKISLHSEHLKYLRNTSSKFHISRSHSQSVGHARSYFRFVNETYYQTFRFDTIHISFPLEFSSQHAKSLKPSIYMDMFTGIPWFPRFWGHRSGGNNDDLSHGKKWRAM